MIDTTETTMEMILRYGLYLGAAFQLACIGAVFVGNSEPVLQGSRVGCFMLTCIIGNLQLEYY